MIKLKAKSIENVAERAKERAFGKLNEGARIGIVVSSENFSGARNYGLKLAYQVQNSILRLGVETEIITLPTLADRYKEFTTENHFIDIYRSQVANMTELLLSEKSYDGLVIMAKGISSKIGMLQAAARLNLPTIVFGEGPSTVNDGANLAELLSSVGQVCLGKMSTFDLQEKEETQTEYVGEGNDFNVSNLINIILEGAGLSVVGNSITPASSIAREKLTQLTASAIVDMTKDHLTIRKLLTKKTLANMFAINYALGGSTQVIDYLVKIANELDLDYTFDKALSLSKGISVYYDTQTRTISDFKAAGGIFALLKVLAKDKLIDESVKGYKGNIADDYKNLKIGDSFAPIHKCAHIYLKGNIANKNSIIKTLATKGLETFEGKARVYADDDSASAGVLSKAIPSGSVIIIKNSSKTQTYGGSTPSQTCLAIQSMGLEDNYVVLTDGQIPDPTKVMVVGMIRPEGEDGIVRILQDGDDIEIDFNKGKLNVDLSNKEITQREKRYVKENKAFAKFAKDYIKLESK